VNIDNGFGAGFVASLINRRWEEQSAAADGRSDR
jgi:NCAIR mutase (PurE)-related protein